jgi:membrane-bound lytic murein transglycosylase F
VLIELDQATRNANAQLRAAVGRAAIALAVLLSACTKPPAPSPPEEQRPVELKVLTVEEHGTQHGQKDGAQASLEYELVKMFADEIDANVTFEVQPNVESVVPLVAQGRAHFAAAGIAITPLTEKLLRFALPYQTVQQQVVAKTKRSIPKGFGDLLGRRLVVAEGSAQVESLRQAKKDFPGLEWTEVPASDPLLPMQAVAEGKADAALTDSRFANLATNYYPKLTKAFDSGPELRIAWAFPKDGDTGLLWKAQNFFERIAYDGTLERMVDRYYGHAENLGSSDAQNLLEKMGTVLPRYRHLFHEGQRITGIDWRLIAALSFQESHWDPLATSFTGVRGIMMLTEDTADRLKVSDRLDPKQAIPAGARYLAELRDQLPRDVREPDRTWMALAAYNLGYGHLNGARTIAPSEGIESQWWVALRSLLPKLSQPAYAARLKAGPARGTEAVQFVENVRSYYDILQRFQPAYDPSRPSARR